jgi:N-acyl-L-homoserine lactone synthetase
MELSIDRVPSARREPRSTLPGQYAQLRAQVFLQKRFRQDTSRDCGKRFDKHDHLRSHFLITKAD